MSWLVYAFSGPVLWAISIHLDKYLVERYFKHADVAVLLVFTSITGLMMLPALWLFEPQVVRLPWWSCVIIATSGLIFIAALFLYYKALQSEEASVVAPFFQVSPLFAYVLAYVFLGETLSATQWLGAALIIGGTLLLSWRSGGARKFKTRLVVLMLGCALLLSSTSLVFKIFAIREEFWTTIFWTFAGQAAYAGILLVGSYRRHFVDLVRANRAALLTINGVNEIINLGGSLGSRYALVLAPISLVQAVTSTTTLFVFIFGVALTMLFPGYGNEDVSPKTLVRTGMAVVLVAAGVAVVGG